MFKLFLSFICRMGIVVLGLVPFATIEAAPDHLLSFLIGTALAMVGCYKLNQLSIWLEKKPESPVPVKMRRTETTATKRPYVA